MTNWTELKRLAEEAITARPGNWYTPDDCCWWTGNTDEGDFIAAANPKTILALIAENDRLRSHLDRQVGGEIKIPWSVARKVEGNEREYHCDYAGCSQKAHPGTSLCLEHHTPKARATLKDIK